MCEYPSEQQRALQASAEVHWLNYVSAGRMPQSVTVSSETSPDEKRQAPVTSETTGAADAWAQQSLELSRARGSHMKLLS
ncbi:hypothetical protein NDU88_005872 [Pleurodeles waltl]|uniref:Uncharacterized protein n=1 Tax=Pleurodeles waltl TaxID=8319 RepID=A0AAV7L3W0_PLEWA|nr:hypothetical protein NDU88_005872 [Pleurodeles waltl]